jgi:hypothetical protein
VLTVNVNSACGSSPDKTLSIAIQTAIISASGAVICPGDSYTITPAGASTYTFSGGSPIVSPSVTTSYSITGTTTLGCVTQSPAVITITVAPTPTITVNSGSICYGQSYTMTPSGANTYTFSSGSPIVSPTITTSYSVIGTSSAGCVSTASAICTVSVGTVNISVNSGTICVGQSFTIVPSGANSYTYSGGSAVVSPSVSTNYNVVGTTSAGCISNSAICTVSVISTPTAFAGSPQTITCASPSVVLNGSGINTFTWSGPGIVGGGNTGTPTVNAVGIYSLIGTWSGCPANNTAVVTVTINTVAPSVSISPSSNSMCVGNTITLTASGANSYSWNIGSTFQTITDNPVNTYTYIVSGTYSVNGCSSTATQVIMVVPIPTVYIASSSPSLCLGSNCTLSASGANSYTWYPGGPGNSIIVSPTAQTTYSVVGSNGCIGSVSFTLNTVSSPTVTAISSGFTLCAGETATLSASGANNYVWNPGGTGSVIVVSPSVSTTYTVTGTDLNNCPDSDTLTEIVTTCTGLKILNEKSEILIYPNPTSGEIKIENCIEGSNIFLFDLLGQIIYEGRSNHNGSLVIDISGKAKGVYLMVTDLKGSGKMAHRIIKD